MCSLIHVVADSLSAKRCYQVDLCTLPSTEVASGPIGPLPPATTKLPRPKHVCYSPPLSCLPFFMFPLFLFIVNLHKIYVSLLSQLPTPGPPTQWKFFVKKKGQEIKITHLFLIYNFLIYRTIISFILGIY